MATGDLNSLQRQSLVAEDEAHVSGDIGYMALGVRKDTGATIAGTDGDYTPMQFDSSGNLRVNLAAGSIGGANMTDDAVFTPGTTAVTPIAGTFDDTSPDSVDEGDGGAVRMSARRELYVQIRDAAGNERGLNVDANGALAITHGALTELAAAIDTEVQVDVVGSLPAGTNAIGKLAANSGVDIGDVDVTSIIPGTGATNLGKAIDSVGGATDTGIVSLVIRDDALGALTPVEGDYVSMRVDANGALWTHDDALDAALSGSELQVDVVAALPAGTNAIGKLAANSGVDIGDIDVTSIIPGTGATNLGKAIDSVGGATDTGIAPLAIRDDALGALTPVEGDYVPLRTDANGALWTHDDALDAALSGSELQVDIVAALPAGTNAIGKLAANSGVDIGDVDVTSVPAPLNVTGGGVEASALRVTIASDSTGVLSVDDNAGSLTVDQATASNLNAQVVGSVADDGTTPGNPVMIGGKAVETDGTDPGSVSAEDDVAIARTDRNRRLLVNTAHPNQWVLYEDHTTAQTNNQLKAAPGAGLSLYITDVIISNGATAGTVKLVEDESGSPVQISQTMYFAINGGAALHFITPKRLTANKTLGFTSVTVTTHSVEVHGYIAP